MTETSKLRISSEVDAQGVQLFLLSGQMDVTAGIALDGLANIDAGSRIVLDFASVERVNSMGLAQLMKLLEQWKKNNIQIEVRNLSRMVSMLFKMTGLNRYFSQGQAATEQASTVKAKQVVNAPGASTEANTTEAPPKLRQVRRIRMVKNSYEEQAESKLKFSVSLQSNQQLTGWYFFNTMLQKKLEKSISIDINQPGNSVDLHQFGLVFAKPFDACILMKEHQFIPVARPMNDTDEVSIIVRKENRHKAIADYAGASVVTAMECNFVYVLGRFLCDEYSLNSSELDYSFTGNEIKALQTLLKGQADMLFMLKKNYHQLSRLSREETHLLEESESAMAYHMLLLSPHYESLKPQLTDNLFSMQEEEKGRMVLDGLGLKGWSKTEDDEINMLLMLYERYVDKVI